MAVAVERKTAAEQLRTLVEWVKDGKWCRDETDNGRGQMCAGGLCSMIATGNPNYWHAAETMRLLEILDRAIPVFPDHLATGEKQNGGTMRGKTGHGQRIASYNNTVRDEGQIIDWFENAALQAERDQL